MIQPSKTAEVPPPPLKPKCLLVQVLWDLLVNTAYLSLAQLNLPLVFYNMENTKTRLPTSTLVAVLSEHYLDFNKLSLDSTHTAATLSLQLREHQQRVKQIPTLLQHYVKKQKPLVKPQLKKVHLLMPQQNAAQACLTLLLSSSKFHNSLLVLVPGTGTGEKLQSGTATPLNTLPTELMVLPSSLVLSLS